MLTSSDPAVLRARAWAHGSRPMASSGLAQTSLGGVPAISANGFVFVAEHDAPAARATAAAAGMTDAGTAPLMTLELSVDLADSPCRGVERAVDPATVDEVAELVRAAFGLRGSTGLRHDLGEVPGADAWLLREPATGRAVAALVATADPDLVGIWSMATFPARQREGHGRCLLRAVLGHYALEGARTACLISTPAGESLYRSIGFEPIEHLQVWQPA